MDTPPESATKPALTPEVAELFRLMTMQQEKIMTANRESMIGLLQELKKGRSDQIDSDNADRQRVAEEMAERTRAQKELEERQLALREEELRVARQAEERRRVQQEEELRLRREELEAQKRREEMLEEQRQADLQQRRQELRERREAEERKARLKTISLPPPMSGKADLLEFVQLFERTARRKELPEEDWTPTLVPLLNEKYRGIAMKLPADIVDDFQQLKQALQDRDDAHTKNAASTFWTMPKKKGTSAIEYHQAMIRLIHRFATGDDKDSLLDSIVRERITQELPLEGRTYVRQRKPTTGLQAAQLAEEWFQLREETYSGWTSEHTDLNSGNQTYRRYRPYYKGGRRETSPNYPKKEDTSKVEDKSTKGVTPQAPEQSSAGGGKGQQAGGGRGGSGATIRCFLCGERGHKKPNCPKKTQKVNVIHEVICQLCKGVGHEAGECPSKVNLIGIPLANDMSGGFRHAGVVEDKTVDNIFVDSGAQVSVVARETLPQDHKTTGSVRVRPLASPSIKCPVTTVRVHIGKRDLKVRAAILDREILGHDLLLGDNIPGLKLKDLIRELEEPCGAGTHSIPHTAEAHKDDTQQTTPTAETPQPETETQAVQQNDESDRPYLVNVVTRAQERTAAEETEAAQKADEDFGKDVTSWDGIPTEEELPPLPPEDEHMELLQPANVGWKEFLTQQHLDGTLKGLWTQARDNPGRPYAVVDGTLVKRHEDRLGQTRELLVVPQQHRKKCFQEAHSHKLAGHFGRRKTKEKVLRYYTWPGLDRDIQTWARTCPECQRGNKTKETRSPLVPLPVISTPWERIALDVVGPLPRSKKGYRYILTIIDHASRYPEAIPLKKIDAQSMCEALIPVLARFGIPAEILTDNGTNFMSSLTQELCRMLDISTLRISPHNPRSNGLIERWHRVLKTILVKTGDWKNWDDMLPMALFASRDTPHRSTGLTPFEVVFGRDVRGPSTMLREIWRAPKKLPVSAVEYLQQLRERARVAEEVSREIDEKAKEDSKTYYDQRSRDDPLEPGEEVLVLHPAGPRGISAQWIGPFVVEERLSPVSYRLATPGKKASVLHRNHLKRFQREYPVNLVVIAEDGEEFHQQLPLVDPLEKEPEGPVTHSQDLAQDKIDSLDNLLKRWNELFQDTPGRTDRMKFEVNTGTASPILLRPYRVPIKWKDKVKDEIETLRNLGIIRPSDSPWSSPIVCVRKPGGELRLCVDYRALNRLTIPDNYPIPRIDELLDRVAGARYITTLDLAKGYYQVPLAEDTIPKTAFITPHGKYEFVTMPFGLRNTPAAFQRLMDGVLRDVEHALAYIDDVVVFSNTWEEHLLHLEQVFHKLHRAGLTVKRRKCRFGTAEVSFLGHVVGGGKLKPQQIKVEALKKYQVPQTKSDLRAFLGLAGYYRAFIPNFSTRAAALTDLTSARQPEKLQLLPQHLEEFRDLQQALQNQPVLTTFRADRHTVLHTDASDRGVWACLSQQDESGREHPVAYFSRKLLPRESRYTVLEKEALAAVEAVKYFAVYLLGTQFDLVTDHRALTSLHRMTGAGARMTRWALALQPFTYSVIHRPGREHGNADSLSRQSWPAELEEPPQPGSAGTRAPSMEGGCWVPPDICRMKDTGQSHAPLIFTYARAYNMLS